MMTVILEQSGGVVARSLTMYSGQCAAVGSDGRQVFGFPGEAALTGVQFTLRASAASCRIEPAAHTRVNGREEAGGRELQAGDRIAAGPLEFAVEFDRDESRGVPAAHAYPMAELLRRQEHPVYAVLDAARDPAVLDALARGETPFVSLFDGTLAEDLASRAPYLAGPMRADLPLARSLEAARGRGWGIFLTSLLETEHIRAHLRGLLMVQAEDRRRFLLRFWDPRVLRSFLPVASQQQLIEMFGPIGSFLTEGENREAAVRFSILNGGLREDWICLSKPLEAAAHAHHLE